MNYAEQLAKIRANLALVEKCFEAHPALFEGADNTILSNDVPCVKWWSWSKTKPEQRQAVARAYPDAGWTRQIRPGSETADWVATIDGVEFTLEAAEDLVVPGNGTRVEFPPVLQESQAA